MQEKGNYKLRDYSAEWLQLLVESALDAQHDGFFWQYSIS